MTFENNNTNNIILNEIESDIVNTIRNGNIQEMIIKMLNGKVNRIDKKLNLNEIDVYKVLKRSNYSEIRIITEAGKVVSVQETIREKV